MKFRLTLFFVCLFALVFPISGIVLAEEKSVSGSAVDISAVSAVLIEGSTGDIIYEKDKDKELVPASITKIMTLTLIFEALDNGKLTLETPVSVSEYAASMGGSQVFLEPNETQTVDTMIKCISIASANDAAVAMAEKIAGSEEAFVKKMNEKAVALGMKHTQFKNCTGLDDNIESGHFSSAYDVALMSRELITKHPEISNYSTVWMDTIIHKTKKGESEFGLTNTNKLVRFYDGITGLKTG
ncbi:MAG TPA: D-alanyl-D-alanine carboxypeptidase, partial [Lachnospiraceae bacterium]|nr:D-alanyl-D-alanine carboxypeptidase [Lachnospiraceae bacterium]